MPSISGLVLSILNSRWDCLCWIEVRYILGYEILEYRGITRRAYSEGRKFNTVRTGYILALNQVGLENICEHSIATLPTISAGCCPQRFPL